MIIMDITSYIDIPITVVTYFIVEIIKKKIFKTNRQRNLLPVIAAVTGAAISIFIFVVWPAISSNVNVLNAFATGAISGSAATGTNQIYKQLTNFFSATNENYE